MGSQQDLVPKHPGVPAGRSLRTAEDYYTRFDNGRKRFVLDEQPDILRHLETIDQATWRKYQTYLKRSTPLERGQFYAQQMANGRYRSIRALARALRRDFSCIARHLRLLKLPEPVQQFLREHRTPAYVRYFNEDRLRELLKLSDPRAAWRRLQGMVTEADRQGRSWTRATS